MAASVPALPPGVLSLHVLPAEHHDRDWDAIIVPAAVKERLLGQALLTLKHGRKLAQLAGLPHGLIVLAGPPGTGDRKSTRLNSSHLVISYAVFCLKKKKTLASRHIYAS